MHESLKRFLLDYLGEPLTRLIRCVEDSRLTRVPTMLTANVRLNKYLICQIYINLDSVHLFPFNCTYSERSKEKKAAVCRFPVSVKC